MGALVQYRDLPGGPTELRLCDELSRHCMCSSCGMLSMSMLQDPNQHNFCETCLTERSTKYNSNHIYCSYENQEVDIFKMYEASDLITVIRDQLAECPNPECKKNVPLQELKEHYTKCKPAVMCSTCHQQVKSAEWSDHNTNCNKQEAGRAQLMGAVPKHFRPKDALPSPKSSAPVKINSYQNSQQTFGSLYPSSELQETQSLPQISTNEGPEKMTLCPHCQRKIKERNLDRHLLACSKVPKTCCYCDGKFIADEIKSHVPVCEENPDSVLKRKPEKREVTNTQVASGSQVSRGGSPSYASALKNGKHAGGNNSPITRPQPKGTLQKDPAQGVCTRSKGASKTCTDPRKGQVRADIPVWLECLHSGDLLAAFAAFEESVSKKKMDEAFKYPLFTTALVEVKKHEMVGDLLEKPCQTQPLDYLMVAIFAREFLLPKVWAKSKEKITWDDVWKYLPHILVSRLKKKTAMEYLSNYPVFLDERKSHVDEDLCSTEKDPSRSSHPSNPTPPAAPTNVADPLRNGKNVPDASGVAKAQEDSVTSANQDVERGGVKAKGNHSDGGDSPGEELPCLHTGEKDAFQKPPAKVEAKLPDKRKCHDSESSPKKDFENGVTKTGPPFGSGAEYTPKEAASEHMQAATDQEGAITMPSKFSMATSYKEDTILFGIQDKGNFSRTMAKEETALKAENTSSSVDSSDLKLCSELSSGLQPSKHNRVNTPCKDSNISKRLENLSSAAKGTMQHGIFSGAAFSPTGTEVSHQKLICSTEHTAPSTQNEPAFMGKPETRDGHPKGIVPENVTKGAKCRNESTSSSGSNESGLLEGMTKVVIKAPEYRNTSSSLRDGFRGRNLRESSAFSAANRQLQNTVQAGDFSDAEPVAPPTKADACPVPRVDSTEHKTTSTKKEHLFELLHQAPPVAKISLASDSAPLTASDVPKSLRDEDTKHPCVGDLTAVFEGSSSEQLSLKTRCESVSSMNNLTARQEVPVSKTEQHFRSDDEDFEDVISSRLSQLNISREDRDACTTPTSGQSTHSQIPQELALEGEGNQVDSPLTEGRAPAGSLEKPPGYDTRCCRRGRSNSTCWTDPQ